jgi:hypothetical protein
MHATRRVEASRDPRGPSLDVGVRRQSCPRPAPGPAARGELAAGFFIKLERTAFSLRCCCVASGAWQPTRLMGSVSSHDWRYGLWGLVMLRIFLCLLLLLGSTQAMAQWTQNQRTESVKNCVTACLKNPNVQPTRQGQCQPYCECGVEATQKTLPNYQTAMEEINRDPNAKRAIEEIMTACGRHFLSGSPEDSLRQISN